MDDEINYNCTWRRVHYNVWVSVNNRVRARMLDPMGRNVVIRLANLVNNRVNHSVYWRIMNRINGITMEKING